MFVPMFMNNMPSGTTLNRQPAYPTKEMTNSFQSIMEGITDKFKSIELQSQFESFSEEEVKIDLIDLFQKMNLLDSFPSEDEAFVQSLMTGLEQLLNLPKDELIEQINAINELLLDEDLIETDNEWIEKTIVFLFEQMSQATEMNQATPTHQFNEQNRADVTSLTRQADTLIKLLTFYLTGSKLTDQSMTSSGNQQQIIENIQHLRQDLNETSGTKLTQFLEKLETHLKLVRQETNTTTNIQQTIQRLVVETFQTKVDDSKQSNPLTFRSYQLHPTVHFGNVMSPVEQYTIFVNQSASSTGSIQEQIIEQLQQIIQTSRFGQVGGSNQLTIQLKPAHLGDMVLRFIQEDNQLNVRMIVTTKAAKEMLEANLNQLRHLFSPGQIVIERQTNEQFQQQLNNYFDEQKEQEQQNQDEQPKKKKENKDNDTGMSFQDYLFHEEV